MNRQKIFWIFLYLIIFFVLVFIYYSGGNISDEFSENVIFKTAEYYIKNGFSDNYWIMYANYNPDTNFKDLYLSQIGLHGFIYTLIIKYLGIKICQIFVASLLTLILLLLLIFLHLEFGFIIMFAVFIVMLKSSSFVTYGNCLFFSLYSLFIPFIISLYTLWFEERSNSDLSKKHFFLFNLFIFLAVFLKCLFLFEEISICVLGSICPVFYFAVKNKWEIKKIFKYCFSLLLVSLVAFILSIGIHFLQLLFFFQNHIEFKRHIEIPFVIINNDIARRIGFAKPIMMYDLSGFDYTESLNASKIYVLKLYLNKFVIISVSMKRLLCSYFLIIPLLILYNFIPSSKKIFIQKLNALFVFSLISLITSASWYIIASPQAYEHPHIFGILWSFPAVFIISSLFVYEIYLYFISLLYYFSSVFKKYY